MPAKTVSIFDYADAQDAPVKKPPVVVPVAAGDEGAATDPAATTVADTEVDSEVPASIPEAQTLAALNQPPTKTPEEWATMDVASRRRLEARGVTEEQLGAAGWEKPAPSVDPATPEVAEAAPPAEVRAQQRAQREKWAALMTQAGNKKAQTQAALDAALMAERRVLEASKAGEAPTTADLELIERLPELGAAHTEANDQAAAAWMSMNRARGAERMGKVGLARTLRELIRTGGGATNIFARGGPSGTTMSRLPIPYPHLGEQTQAHREEQVLGGGGHIDKEGRPRVALGPWRLTSPGEVFESAVTPLVEEGIPGVMDPIDRRGTGYLSTPVPPSMATGMVRRSKWLHPTDAETSQATPSMLDFEGANMQERYDTLITDRKSIKREMHDTQDQPGLLSRIRKLSVERRKLTGTGTTTGWGGDEARSVVRSTPLVTYTGKRSRDRLIVLDAQLAPLIERARKLQTELDAINEQAPPIKRALRAYGHVQE